MQTIPAKTILSGYRNDGWFGSNYNMNLYRGCCHGCIYCDSRSDCYGIDDFDTVRIKENALTILERELQGKRKTGIVHFGSMSDSYNPYEATQRLSRGALELLHTYGYGVCIPTKSTLIARDADVLQAIARRHTAVVNVTVNTVDDELCAKIEPHAPLGRQRLEALAALRKQGILGGVLLMPLLPFILDNEANLAVLTEQAAAHGAQWIYATMGMSARDRQRTYYYQELDKHFPGVRELHHQTYGGTYACHSPRAKALWAFFAEQCQRLGLLYTMPDITAFIQSQRQQEQLSLPL